jgi:formamidopyrimidine-DNA glycosylase
MKYVLKYAVSLRRKQIMHNYSADAFLGTEKHDFKKSFLQAHRHFDNKCPKNSEHTLKKATIAGRTAYFCPVDQK